MNVHHQSLLARPFLTDIDHRAQVKGSRDPLGIQPIWVRVGRHVVGNLTTQSTSLRDFTVLLIGVYLFEQFREAVGRDFAEVDAFLKWEQLTAYARARFNHDLAFRGTERVQAALDRSSRVVISAERDHQILGNQRIYGIWGLYTAAARTSRLLDLDPVRLTPEAREFVRAEYLDGLEDAAGKHCRDLLLLLQARASRLELDGKHERLAKAVAALLAWKLSDTERSFYCKYLLWGGPDDRTDGRQRQLANLLAPMVGTSELTFSPPMVQLLAREASRKGTDHLSLAHFLSRIAVYESVLAPTGALFSFLLAWDGSTVVDVAAKVKNAWGAGLPWIEPQTLFAVREDLLGATGDPEQVDAWLRVANGLRTGAFEDVLRTLLGINNWVMERRGAGPWIRETGEGTLTVKFRDETADLPPSDRLRDLWRYPYFLSALRAIATPLQEV